MCHHARLESSFSNTEDKVLTLLEDFLLILGHGLLGQFPCDIPHTSCEGLAHPKIPAGHP